MSTTRNRDWRRTMAAGLLLVLLAAGGAPAATRVALVADGPGQAVEEALLMAEARLAKVEGLQMLERRAIEKILAEQKLSLAGPADAEKAVAAGKVLSVDLFAVVESGEEAKQALGVVVFSARTGARLVDTALADGDAEKAAAGIAAAVSDADRKFRLPRDESRTVCLLTVRNAELPRAMDPFCEAAGRLLERELIGCPALALLERARLEHVTRERAAAPEPEITRLLASLVLVSLDVGRGADGQGLRATALLSDAQGKALAKAEAKAAGIDAAALAEGLAQKVLEALGAKPPAAEADLEAEAARFHEEARVRLRHSDYLAAIRAADAAAALAPDSRLYRQHLAFVLAHTGQLVAQTRRGIEPTQYRPEARYDPFPGDAAFPADLLIRAVELHTETTRAYAERFPYNPRFGNTLAPDREPSPDFLHRSNDAAWTGTPYYRETHDAARGGADLLSMPAPSDPAAAARLRLLHGRWRGLLVEVQEPLARARVRDADSFARYAGFLPLLLETCRRFGDDLGDARFDRMASLLARFLEMAKTWPVSGHKNVAAHFGLMASALEISAAEARKHPPAEYDRLLGLVAPLAAHRDPVIRAEGLRLRYTYEWMKALALGEKQPGDMTAAEVPAFSKPLHRHVFAVLAEEDGPHPAFVKRHCAVTVVKLANSLLPSVPHRQRLEAERELVRNLLACVRKMLDRGEVDEDLITLATFWGRNVEPAATPAFLDAAIAALDSPQGRSGGFDPRYLRQLLVKTKQRLEGIEPAREPDYDKFDVAWTSVRNLLDVSSDPGFARAEPGSAEAEPGGPVELAGVVRFGDRVYACGIGRDAATRAGFLQLLQVGLKDGAVRRLARTAQPSSAPQDPTGFGSRFFMGAGADQRHYALATWGGGLIIFPTDGGAARTVDASSGLPSNLVHTAAVCDGAVVAWVGEPGKESFLVSRPAAGGPVKVLAATRRKERQSPLDDTGPLYGFHMLADHPRRRVIFSVSPSVNPYVALARPDAAWEALGVWQVRLERGAVSRLLPTRRACFAAVPEFPDRLYLLMAGGMVVYDLPTDTPTPAESAGAVTSIDVQDDNFSLGGWGWGAFASGVMRRQGRRIEYPLSPRGDGRKTLATTCFQPLGDGSILLGDEKGLFIVRLDDAPAAGDATKSAAPDAGAGDAAKSAAPDAGADDAVKSAAPAESKEQRTGEHRTPR